MPAPKSNGTEASPWKGSGEPSANEIIGSSKNGKFPRKRQRKPAKLAAAGSYTGVIREPAKDIKKRKRMEKQASEPGASLGNTLTAAKTPRSGSQLKGRRRSSKSMQDSDLKPHSNLQEGSECPPDLAIGEATRLDEENSLHSTDEVTALKEGSTKSQRPVIPKAVPASARINVAKGTHSTTTPEQNAGRGEMDHGRRPKQRRKSRKTGDRENVDEKLRIKRRVKNLVNRIRLEQNLLDAYAGEGWKGHSREKIRPEMELQRAHTQILRCKIAIRDLIRDLDNLALEGSIQESAFDEEGRIFHEEIFCAKCKSQEASIDNDIILCDGACDRGFHQECLEPPLATSDIPPGDEGWLCPVCDCKVECLNYINGYLSTEFQLEDRWEQIFAAAAGSVDGASNAMGADWPSEDSDDDDYDPEKKAVRNENEQEEGGDAGQKTESLSGSESEPEASSASDVTDDSSSSSDVSGDELEHTDRRPRRRDSEYGRVRDSGNICHDPEIPTTALESEDAVPVLGKRQRKPVDYKKLHAEMFGKDDEDGDVHSEDEEWGPRTNRRGNPEVSKGVSKTESNSSVLGKGHDLLQVKSLLGQQSVDGNEPYHVHTKSLNGRQSDDRKSRRLPDGAVEILRQEFESGTCFPTRAYKESLTQKLGISFQQISSWFKHARHVAKHGTGQGTPTWAPETKDGIDVTSNGNSRGGELGVDEIEVTNGLLIEKLEDVQVKLHHLMQTLEAIGVKPNAGSESNLLGYPGDVEPFDTGIVMSRANGKHILYVPVAEVVEKDPEEAHGNR